LVNRTTAYNGWVGTAQATLAVTASGQALQTYVATSTSTVSSVQAIAGIGSEAHVVATINLPPVTTMSQVLNAILVNATVALPTLQVAATGAVANAVSGYSSLLVSAFGAGFLASLGDATGTLQLAALGALYPSPLATIEGEEVVYFDTDDRLVYMTE
jgi:hypothetical protein